MKQLTDADKVYLRVWHGASYETAVRVVRPRYGKPERPSTAFHGKPSASLGTRCICDSCRAARGLLPIGKRQVVAGR